MPDRVSKVSSASAESLGESRECFIEVYINNQWLIIIVYHKYSAKMKVGDIDKKTFLLIFVKMFYRIGPSIMIIITSCAFREKCQSEVEAQISKKNRLLKTY